MASVILLDTDLFVVYFISNQRAAVIKSRGCKPLTTGVVEIFRLIEVM